MSPEERLWLTGNQSRIVLAIETGYAPFIFIDSSGQPAGLANDYMRLLESKLGVDFKQRRFSSLDDIFNKVRGGEVQIVNAVTQTPWRSTFLNLTNSFISVPNVFIVRKDRSGQIREENLSGMTVSLVKKYAVTEYLTNKNPGFTPDLVADDLTTLLNVSFGRSDAAVIDLATASYLISQKGITNLRVAGEAPFDIRLSMGASIDEPVLYSILEKGLAAITDEERQEIQNRWINTSRQSILSDRRFWMILGSVLGVIFTGIAVILIWNRMLRRQVTLRTEALAQEKEFLKKSEAMNRALINAMPDLFFLNHRSGEILFIHMPDSDIAFATTEISLHRNIEKILPKPITDQFMKAFADALDQSAMQELNYSLPINGKEKWFEARVAPFTVDEVITFVRDVSVQKEAEHLRAQYHHELEKQIAERTAELSALNIKLLQLSETDALTGIANRHKYDIAMNIEWLRAIRERQPLALLIIDIDYFKQYNDQYGHQAGDECLQRVAEILNSSVQRVGDLAARYGGEEFAVILPGLNAPAAAKIAEKIRHTIESKRIPHVRNTPMPIVTVSIGVASCMPDQDQHMSTLLYKADACLYQAKHNGRNRVVVA
ncbi:MAG: diguanylate cyclase [Methylobacter sp.]